MGNELSQEDGQETRPDQEVGRASPQSKTVLSAESCGGLQSARSLPPRSGQRPVAVQPQVDLSNLSEEERAKILSVMALAEDMDKDLTRHRRASEELVRTEATSRRPSGGPSGATPKPEQLCPLCHMTELTSQTAVQCAYCGKYTCGKCRTSLQKGDSKGPVRVCVECIRRRSQSTTKRQESSSQLQKLSEDEKIKYSQQQPKLIQEPSRPQQSSKPVTEHVRVQQPSKPVTEPVRVQQQSKPVTEPVRVQQPSKPVTELARVQQSSKPDTELARVQQSSKPDTLLSKVQQPLQGASVEPLVASVSEPSKDQYVSSSAITETSKVQQPVLGTVAKTRQIIPTTCVNTTTQLQTSTSSLQNVHHPSKPELVTSTDKSKHNVHVFDEQSFSYDRSGSKETNGVTTSAQGLESFTNRDFVAGATTALERTSATLDVVDSVESHEPKVISEHCENIVEEDTDQNGNGYLAGEELKEDYFERLKFSSLESDEIDEEYEKEGEEEEEEDSDEELDAPTILQPLAFFDRSPGEVYTIPEEEDEPSSPTQSRIAGSDLNSDTASSLIRWRGVGQTYRNASGTETKDSSLKDNHLKKPEETNEKRVNGANGNTLSQQQQQRKDEVDQIRSQSVPHQITAMSSTEQKYHQYEDISREIPVCGSLGFATSTTEENQQDMEEGRSVSASLPRTVPLTSVSQSAPQQQQTIQSSQADDHQQIIVSQASNKQKPKSIDLQGQKKQKPKPEPQDWSPVSDLSPIMDVSPSVEAAEQELMEKFREKAEEEEQSKPVVQASIPRATSGTISGMIADFNKALGLSGSSPIEDQQSKVNFTTISPPRPSVVSGREIDTSKDQNQNVVSCIPHNTKEQRQTPAISESEVVTPVVQQQHAAQPSTPRRIHRRLPQPTMEQMQAAVAMAAQTPRGKVSSQVKVPVTTSFGPQMNIPTTSVSTTRPVSPSVLSNKVNDKKQSDQQVPVTDSFSDQGGHTMKVTAQIHQVDPLSKQTDQQLANQKVFTSSIGAHSLVSSVVLTCGVTSLVTSSTTTMATVTSRHVVAGSSPTPLDHMPTYVSPRAASLERTSPTIGLERDVSALSGKGDFLSTESPPLSLLLRTGNGTPQSPGTPRDKTVESSDTQSEADSSKSGKVRRKLPPLPQDQEPSPIPTRRGKDRARNLSIGSSPLHLVDRQWAQRTSSLDSAPLTTSTGDLTRVNLSDHYIKQLGSLNSQPSEPPSTAMPKKDVSQKPTPSYLKSPLMTPEAVSQRLGLADFSLAGSKLPTYMQNLKQQLREELRTVTEERKRLLEIREKSRSLYRRSETDLASLLPSVWSGDPVSQLDTLATHRIASHSSSTPLTTKRSTSARTSPQGSPRKSRHRRHASDPKLPPFSPIKEVHDTESEMATFSAVKNQNINTGAFKSFEFESIDEQLNYGEGRPGWHHHDEQEGNYTISEGQLLDSSRPQLRETAISSIVDDRNFDYPQKFSQELARGRRPSEGSSRTLPATFNREIDQWERNIPAQFLTSDRKTRKEKKSRKPRSWHPSPYVSEDEDDQMTREEKKAKVKEEIARRRLQIEQNSRLYDELHKLAKTREASEQRAYQPNQSIGHVYSTSSVSDTYRLNQSDHVVTSDPTSTSTVLQAIDEILKKDAYSSIPSWSTESSKHSRAHYTTAPSTFSTSSASVYDYLTYTGAGPKRHANEPPSPSARFPENTAEDESIAKIAATFPAEHPARGKVRMRPQPRPRFDPVQDFSPMATDTETPTDTEPTPAMPLLPDMPTRSRKLLEDLGSSPIVNQLAQGVYHDRLDSECPGYTDETISDPTGETGNARRVRKAQSSIAPKTSQKYDFPVKRILLTRDPKDRSVSGNGLGMKVVGGKEIPGNNGMIGAYVAKIYPGGVVETLGEVQEGDLVLEWNGIPLTGKTYEDVQRVVASSGDEVEIVIRSDVNVHDSHLGRTHQRRYPRMGPQDLRNGPESGKTGNNHGDEGDSNSGTGHNPGGNNENGCAPRESSNIEESKDPIISNSSSYDNVDGLKSSEQGNKDVASSNCSIRPGSESYEPCLLTSQLQCAPERTPPSNPRLGNSTNSACNHHPSPIWTSSQYPNPKSTSLSESNKYKFRTDHITGEIQLQICYDSKAGILYITIVRARNLVTARDNSGLPDPFVKCYLLPVRCMENQRRTRYFSRCSSPEWKQTLVYPNIPPEDLPNKFLEISVWNYDIYRPNEFLGEIILDLSDETVLDEQPRWYKLQEHDESRYPRDPVGGPRASFSHGSLGSVTSGDSGRKMARLNNLGFKFPFSSSADEIKRHLGHEKKLIKPFRRKSIGSTDPAKGREQPATSQSGPAVPY
ncbi:uncharacterized protein LOC143237566 isoform X2 [Tachypleus tridentatus]|uniref:uncharacterized protein LOC143237566 isoform X2 n=1 Tax=Tachypleus tridentatus TaxID=6853 RepID=UPI003FD35661